MCKTVAIVSFAMFGTANAAACDPVDSCPKLSDGLYCPVNDVTEHGDINRDVAEISKLLKEDPINYAGAKTVYTDGLYSSKGGGNMRTLQALAQKDMTVNGKYTNVFYSGFVDMYGSYSNVWDAWMLACLDNTGWCQGKSDSFRKYIINKGAIGIVTGYVTYEMGAAVWKAADGQTMDSGAPYAWDEAAAFHVGNVPAVTGNGYDGVAPGNLYSPYEFAWKRDKDFPDGTVAHQEAIKLLNYGLINVRGSGYTEANVLTAQTGMYKLYAIAAIRSAIKYSWKAVSDEKYVAEGAAYWRSASGYISTVSTAVKTLVQEVDAIFDVTQSGTLAANKPCEVKDKVEAMYKDLGITCAMVGIWTGAEGCLATACDDGSATGTLPAGSTAYVDMCKATEASAAHDRSLCAVAALLAALAAVVSWAA